MLGMLRSTKNDRLASPYGPDELIFEQLVFASAGRAAARIEIKTGLFADYYTASFGQFVIFQINGVDMRKVQKDAAFRTRLEAEEACRTLGRTLVNSLRS